MQVRISKAGCWPLLKVMTSILLCLAVIRPSSHQHIKPSARQVISQLPRRPHSSLRITHPLKLSPILRPLLPRCRRCCGASCCACCPARCGPGLLPLAQLQALQLRGCRRCHRRRSLRRRRQGAKSRGGRRGGAAKRASKGDAAAARACHGLRGQPASSAAHPRGTALLAAQSQAHGSGEVRAGAAGRIHPRCWCHRIQGSAGAAAGLAKGVRLPCRRGTKEGIGKIGCTNWRLAGCTR